MQNDVLYLQIYYPPHLPVKYHFYCHPHKEKTTMNYIDAYVLAVLTANKDAYRDLAEKFETIMKA